MIYIAPLVLTGTVTLIGMLAFDHFDAGGLDSYPKAEYAFSLIAGATILLGCAMSIGIITMHL